MVEKLNNNEFKDWKDNFQTPDHICTYMSSFLPANAGLILEPTPGKGKLVNAIKKRGSAVYSPINFDLMENKKFDWVVMNPPFTPMKKVMKSYIVAWICLIILLH